MLNLLLLFFFITYSETPPVGTPLKHVEGIKGGNVTLDCEYHDKDISHIRYVSRGKSTHFSDIPDCLDEKYKHESGRVCKRGACDIILKDLNFSDHGRYLLRFYYKNSPKELEFHLRVHDEISVKNLDVLLSKADKVEINSNEGWKEVSKRVHGVNSDQRNDRDGNLTINNFTVNDAESGSRQKLNSKTDDTKTRNHWVSLGTVAIYVLALVVLIAVAVKIKKMQ